ncbi:MAG: hypothetical protein ACI4T5_03270 [Prevotella sp.]
MLRITYFIQRRLKNQAQPCSVSRFTSHEDAKRECSSLNRRGDGIYSIKPHIEVSQPNSRERFMYLAWLCLDVPVAVYDEDGTKRIDQKEHFRRLDALDKRIKYANGYLLAHPAFKPDSFYLDFFNVVSLWRRSANELFVALVRDDPKSRARAKELRQLRNDCEKTIRETVINYAESNKKLQ